MKNRTNWLVFALGVTVVILLVALAGLVKAQDGGPESDDDQVASPPYMAVITNDVVQVQGRLGDAGGAPLNGPVTVTASIYDASTGGATRCTDTDTVIVYQGLFTLSLDYCTADDFNGDQLFLGLKVGADPEMTPRQEIFAVPYAWALRPGAIVKGDDSFLFVPGSAFVRNAQTDTTQWDMQASGAVVFRRGATVGTKTIYIPITLPGVLYGQPTTIEQITVYYKCSNAASYIDYIDLNLQTDADSWLGVIEDNTNLTSTVAASHTLTPTLNNVLSANQGILGFYMYLNFANDTDSIEIGGIRLRLGHQ
jgi:hypothetical protein